MTQATDLMGLYARTSIHAGAGAGDGIIDLPIQREGHTGWPCIFGSGVKGAMRHAAERAVADGRDGQLDINATFGPEHVAAESTPYAGALMVGDARLLLLPIRSLTTCYRQVTCPEILARLAADARRQGVDLACDPRSLEELSVDSETALVTEDGPEHDLFLEEYRFGTKRGKEINETAEVLADFAPPDMAASIRRRLTIVSDDDFSFLARHATPVEPHIAIEIQSKQVKTGALWYEETLPPDTLMVCTLLATRPRGPIEDHASAATAAQVLESTRELFGSPPFLQAGGNETVGMGWFEVGFHSRIAA